MSGTGRLLVIPALRARRAPDGAFILTRKFIDGVLQYVERWPGPVSVAIERTDRDDGNLDHEPVHPQRLPFELRWLDPDPAAVRELVGQATFVLGSLVPQHQALAATCADAGTPMAYVTEYSLLTRQQIIRSETANPLRQWRRLWYERRREQRNLESVRCATGVQCNGTPTFEAYRHLNRHALLYFDTRIRADMIVPEGVLEARLAELRAGGPLRLAFTGRLNAMKGADHLPAVAAELRRRGVAFTLDICGGGDMLPALERAVERHGLQDQVRLRGVLDFHEALVPLVSGQVDLFVCCHRQGDPSCTYLETMSCGTPVVGYDNEAFKGLVEQSNVGWTAPLDDPVALAERVADLDGRRDEVAEAARSARAFAAGHTFERTMQRRIDHMLACCPARPAETVEAMA